MTDELGVLSPRPHPLRNELANELHARPSSPVSPPAVVLRIALVTQEMAASADRNFVEDLCHRFNSARPGENSRWHAARLGDVYLRWERHTELSTLTLHWSAPDDHVRFDSKCPPGWPANWLEGAPGVVLSAVHMEIARGSEPDHDALYEQFGEDLSIVGGGPNSSFAATDFKLDADGFCRVAVWSDDEQPAELGRKVQKLLEIETYRMAALLSFPVATEARDQLGEIENEIGLVMSSLVEGERDGEDSALLARVSELSAKAEAMAARTSYRFAAGRAYHRIVRERLETFNYPRDAKDGLANVQTYEAFLSRRLEPAMRTCDAVEARQQALIERIARATSLLATRVDVKIGEQNAELLTSMNTRTEAQLKLQETVEGLSVFAISYYAVGLFGYAIKAIHYAGVPVDPNIATGIAVPIVMGVLWLGLKQLKKSLGHSG